MRPALVAKAGSRGKSQLRTRHGRMASAESQRQIVVPLISAISPCASTSRRSSVRDQRDSGTQERAGSSQASALTATTTPGGKDERPAAPGLLLEPRAAEEAEALPPLADDLAGGIQAGRDGIIPQPLGRQEDDLGPDDVSIR